MNSPKAFGELKMHIILDTISHYSSLNQYLVMKKFFKFHKHYKTSVGLADVELLLYTLFSFVTLFRQISQIKLFLVCVYAVFFKVKNNFEKISLRKPKRAILKTATFFQKSFNFTKKLHRADIVVSTFLLINLKGNILG